MNRSTWKLGWTLAALLSCPASASNSFKGMAKELAQAAQSARIQRVAVLPFITGGDGDSREGWNIAEKLVTPLVRTGKVQAIERQLIEKIMGEQRLGRTGALDDSGLLAFGKISSAQGIVTGSYIPRGREVVINARLIDAETGLIIAACEQVVDQNSIGMVEQSVSPAPWEKPLMAVSAAAAPGAPVSCADAPAQADRLEAQVIDLKARYWALKLRKTPNAVLAESKPEQLISNPALRKEFQERLTAWDQSGHIPRLSADEVRRFVTVDGEAFSLHQQCGS
jgi:TolB-like protein